MNARFQDFALLALLFLLSLALLWAACILSSPPLVLGIIILRLLQFIKTGIALHNVILFKFYLLCAGWATLGTTVLYPAIIYASVHRQDAHWPLPMLRWYWASISIFILYNDVVLLSVGAHILVPRVRLGHTESGIDVPDRVAEILSCLILWKKPRAYLINPRPSKSAHGKGDKVLQQTLITALEVEKWIEDSRILGLSAEKWIEVVIFTLIGCASISLITHFAVYGIQSAERFELGKNILLTICKTILKGGKSMAYYATGMKRSVSFMLISMMMLLTWVPYFRSNLEETARAKRVLEFVTSTLICLFVCSVFWFLKTWVLLEWEANQIYKDSLLTNDVIKAGNKLYFLGILCRHIPTFDILDILFGHKQRTRRQDSCSTIRRIISNIIRDFPSKDCVWLYIKASKDESPCRCSDRFALKTEKRERVKRDLHINPSCLDGIMTYQTHQVARYLVAAKQYLTKFASDPSTLIDQLKACQVQDLTLPNQEVNIQKLSEHIYGKTIRPSAGVTDTGTRTGEETHIPVEVSTGVTDTGTGTGEETHIPVEVSTGVTDPGTGTGEETHIPVEASIGVTDPGTGTGEETHIPVEVSTGVTDPGTGTGEETHIPVEASTGVTDPGTGTGEERQIQVEPSARVTDESLSPTTNTGGERQTHDWEYFIKEELAYDGDPSGHISFEDLKKWVEEAHKHCLFVANTLSCTLELLDCLNTIINVVIITAIFILWLFLTELASVKVFALLATPLIALNFIFGESSKGLFQSIIFIYAVHPFKIGGTYKVEDSDEMVVESIGVWNTTFTKPGENERVVRVIYPNSQLANKNFTEIKVNNNASGQNNGSSQPNPGMAPTEQTHLPGDVVRQSRVNATGRRSNSF